MKNKTKGNVIKYIAVILFMVGAPLIATMSQFPIWIEASKEATVSGTFLLFAFFCCIPFFKQIKQYFKSPSVWVMWTIIAIFLIVLKSIIEQMVIVAVIGAISNIIGEVLYKAGEGIKQKPDKEKQENGTDNG